MTIMFPSFLSDPSKITVPIRLDVTHDGYRLIDYISWSISYHTKIDLIDNEIHFFSKTITSDLNLRIEFVSRVHNQIKEQISSYLDFLKLVYEFANLIPNWNESIKEQQYISISIRNKSKEYIDTLTWDPLCDTSPDHFAHFTSKDLDLPSEMEPVISHVIREHLFGWIIKIFDKSSTNYNVDDRNISLESERISVKTISHQVSNNMAISLWKRARPNSSEESSLATQPLLPVNKKTNAMIWKRNNSLQT